MQFPVYYLWYGVIYTNDSIPTKNDIEKIYEYASERGASELEFFFAFSHSKTAISFKILLVLLILYFRNIYIFRSDRLKLQSAWYIYHQCSSLFLLMVWRYIYKHQYTDKTLTLKKKKAMYMRVSGASELKKFSNFYILKLLFLSIFCWYFRYFILLVQMTCLSVYMYRQNYEKALGGGGGAEISCIFVFGECTANTGNPRPLINLWLYQPINIVIRVISCAKIHFIGHCQFISVA